MIKIEQKKYIDIQRFKPQFIEDFKPGDYIVIQEKVDGANFSIRYDESTDTVAAFSRRRELNLNNNLRGAWEWSQTLDKDIVKKYLGNNLILFGEWLVPHTIVYPKEAYHKAYFYDIYDSKTDKFYPQIMVEEIVRNMNLIYVPTFYKGEFNSWEHINTFVGKTELGGTQGEGVVVKNITRLNSTDTKHPFYTKIVGENFAEIKGVKKFNPDKLTQREEKITEVQSVVTTARVRKLVNKMVDDGLIPENWDEHNLGEIAKNIGSAVYYDCLREEPEIVEKVGADFGKMAHKTAMRIVRSEILENN